MIPKAYYKRTAKNMKQLPNNKSTKNETQNKKNEKNENENA